MAVDQKKVYVDDLGKGMYIAKLDRPWIETPFPIQGFYVRDDKDIDMLRRYCLYVHVDTERSAPVKEEKPEGRVTITSASASSRPKARTPVYRTVETMKKEVGSSLSLHREVSMQMVNIFGELRKGKQLELEPAQKVASGMVDSLIRNPDAMVWLARVRDLDSYSYNHSIRSSIWAIVMGRHLGLSKQALDTLALGVLLSEVGKTRVPRQLLVKPSTLAPDEMTEVRRHIEYGIEILGKVPGLPTEVISIVAGHHERYDGSGYPGGLSGNQIPALAKIAGIVDSYDAMTSERPYARPLTSTDAVARLYEMRGKQFQSQLVEEFIQAIGVYPTGTLVKLSSEEVAVVIEQNPERRLRPKILVVLDANKQPLKHARVIDLLSQTHDDRGEPLSITTSLLPGSFNVFPQHVQVNAL